jgi:hypothetical protein
MARRRALSSTDVVNGFASRSRAFVASWMAKTLAHADALDELSFVVTSDIESSSPTWLRESVAPVPGFCSLLDSTDVVNGFASRSRAFVAS